eukprot:2743255-Pyramimonas_sp.AAC.1
MWRHLPSWPILSRPSQLRPSSRLQFRVNLSVRASPSAAGPLSIMIGFAGVVFGRFGTVVKQYRNLMRGRW